MAPTMRTGRLPPPLVWWCTDAPRLEHPGGRRWSGRALMAAALAHARRWRAQGVRTGDLLLCSDADPHRWATSWGAAAVLGLGFHPVPTGWTTAERRRHCARLPGHWHVDAHGLLHPCGGPRRPLPQPGVLLATSGTTGPPRLWLHTQTGLRAAARLLRPYLLPQGPVRWLVPLALAYTGGLVACVRAWAMGGTVLAAGTTSGATLAELLGRLGATHASLVPAQATDLLATGTAPPRRLRRLLVGGAHLPRALVDHLPTAWPLLWSYGLSETLGAVALGDPHRRHRGQPCLRPAPGVALRLGAEGRLHVRTPTGYAWAWNAETASWRPGPATGWLATEDRGCRHTRGWSVLGRSEEWIQQGGLELHGPSIAAELVALPGVAAALVFGIPDPRLGQRLVAAVEPAGPHLELARLVAAARERLGRARCPRLWYVGPLARTPSGKLRRDPATLARYRAALHRR